MNLEKLKRIIFNSYKVYVIRVKKELGYCYKNASGSFVIAIRENLPDDKHIYDYVLKHELGHIYYCHFDNKERDYEDIKKLYKDITGKNASVSRCHRILNQAEDIVINDTILSPTEVKEVEDYIEGQLCTSEHYKAPKYLEYPEYYEYVIKDTNEVENNCEYPGHEDEGTCSSVEGDIENGEESKETDEDTERKGGIVINPPESQDPNYGWSNSDGSDDGNKVYTESKDPRKELEDILKKLIVVKYKLPLEVDSMKKYNRGLVSGTLLPKSIKQTLQKRVLDDPICIMVDSSGSMYHIIDIVISTIYKCKKFVHPDSVLVTWGDCLDDEVKFSNLTERVKARLGDNYLLKGCKYIEKKYPNHKRVLISDFYDDDTDKMVNIPDLIRIKVGKDHMIYDKYKSQFQYAIDFI